MNDGKSQNDSAPSLIRDPSPDPLPKRRDDLTYRTIEGETVILNREGGKLHQLNPTASFIWHCCDGTTKVSEIVNRLIGIYEVDAGTAQKDVEEVLSNLRNSNLLQRANEII